MKFVPVPNELPPEAAAYQFNVPTLAVALNVSVPVPQREEGVEPVIVDVAPTVATTAVRPEVQLLSVASTKYVVVVLMLGVTKLVPVPKETPPVKALYQFKVPALAVAFNVTVPLPQRLPGVTVVIVGA